MKHKKCRGLEAHLNVDPILTIREKSEDYEKSIFQIGMKNRIIPFHHFPYFSYKLKKYLIRNVRGVSQNGTIYKKIPNVNATLLSRSIRLCAYADPIIRISQMTNKKNKKKEVTVNIRKRKYKSIEISSCEKQSISNV